MNRNLFRLLCVSLWAVYAVSVSSASTANTSSASVATSTDATSSNSVSQLSSTTSSSVNVTTGALIENTTLRTHEVIKANISKFPYRVCSIAKGTDSVRFEQNIQCESFKPTREEFEEGIMVVYKRDIRAYTFKVNVYQKVLTQRQSYSYINVNYMLGQTVEHLPVPMWEVHYVNRINRCYNSVKRYVAGEWYETYHRDSFVNETMLLLEDYSNSHSSRFVTVKELWHKAGSTWLYTTSSNVNCMVTVTTARSKYPYNYFVTSAGELVDISPFYNGSNNKHFGENKDKFHLMKNYSMVEYYGRENVPLVAHNLVAFFERADSMMSWDVLNESDSTCQFTLWETSERTIRSEAEESYHFTSNSMTATFLAKKTPVNDSDPALECIKKQAEEKIDEIFNNTYNYTYEKSDNVTIYETTGGLIVFWLPVKERSLLEMKQLADGYANMTSTSRKKRSTDNSEVLNSTVVHSIVYAQLQFTYDTLRNYINRALRQIAEAWCKDQRRTLEVLKELSKINPTAMLSAIYDRPVAARYAGDVISLAKCVEVNQTTVQVLRDMHVKDKSDLCYSRPVVLYRFYNSSHVQYGQLGENNEILLGRHRTESCEIPSVKIFIAGNTSYEYVDYVFRRELSLDSIPVVETMISLDIDPLENTDFKALELYSEEELRASNVFNLEEIMQEFNAYKQRVVHVEGKVFDTVPAYLRGLDDLMSGLGVAGKALGVAIGAVGGAVASFVEGIVGFIKNPFGSLTVILFLLAVLGVIYLIYMRQKRVYEQPFQHLFPYIAAPPAPVKETPPPPSYEESLYASIKEKSSSSAKEVSVEEAYQMLLALQKLDAEKRRKQKEDSEQGVLSESGRRSGFLDRVRYRHRGYKPVEENEYEV
ncbi:envelope glycoprotein B [Mandrillus leucophaeus cytomegalovirus]|uniref:Envelope glycoprotein B n=2 Tax=Cytomegalovirus TaxID=10358 RepID=A0A0G2UGP5_9BETA|nr:envelope glycoprotein B [Mandrillus leucophaeus cytomegalovirus]AKI29778.1 envelope glycoprotein B [Mandrillus leucophaeus cytomegalovirus]